MQTSLTFKNMETSDHLRSYVSTKLDRLDKYLYNPAEAKVVLQVEKFRHIAEISITGDRLNIIGKEETEDMYSSIDMVLDKIESQIKKNKEKFRERRIPLKSKSKMVATSDSEVMEEEGEKQVIVNTIDYKPMDVEEAVMQMELIKDNFLVFTNSRTEQVNVLYRRRDGHFGLIKPSN